MLHVLILRLRRWQFPSYQTVSYQISTPLDLSSQALLLGPLRGIDLLSASRVVSVVRSDRRMPNVLLQRLDSRLPVALWLSLT